MHCSRPAVRELSFLIFVKFFRALALRDGFESTESIASKNILSLGNKESIPSFSVLQCFFVGSNTSVF